MRRHWLQRLFAASFAVWFAIAGFGTMAPGACPMQMAMPGMSGMTGGSAAMAAMHAGAHSASGSTVREEPATPATNPCCACPGCCSSCSTPSALPTHAASLHAAVRTQVTQRPATYRFRPVWTDFILPFATAPPAAPSA